MRIDPHQYGRVRRSLARWLLDVGLILVLFARWTSADDAQSKRPELSVRCLVFSPDGRVLAGAGADKTAHGELVTWDVKSFREDWRFSEIAGFSRIAFSPDGKVLALARFAPEAKLLDATSGKLVRELPAHGNQARSVTFTPDGKYLVTGSHDRTIKIWNTSTGEVVATLEGHAQSVFHVAISPEGSFLASADAQAGRAHLWNLQTRKHLHVFEGLGSLVPHVSFSRDGRLLAVSSWTGGLNLFDTASYETWMKMEPGGGIHWAEFSPDQHWLAVATNGLRVHVFPINTNADEKTQQRINQLLAKLDDDSYAIREQTTAELAVIGPAAEAQLRRALKSASPEVRWRSRELRRRLAGPESAIQLKGHGAELECVTFSPDSKLLASGDRDGDVKVWRVEDWKLVTTLSIAKDH